jgi:hypothetical protein
MPMDLNQFRNLFSDEGACRKYLEKVFGPTVVSALTVGV